MRAAAAALAATEQLLPATRLLPAELDGMGRTTHAGEFARGSARFPPPTATVTELADQVAAAGSRAELEQDPQQLASSPNSTRAARVGEVAERDGWPASSPSSTSTARVSGRLVTPSTRSSSRIAVNNASAAIAGVELLAERLALGRRELKGASSCRWSARCFAP